MENLKRKFLQKFYVPCGGNEFLRLNVVLVDELIERNCSAFQIFGKVRVR